MKNIFKPLRAESFFAQDHRIDKKSIIGLSHRARTENQRPPSRGGHFFARNPMVRELRIIGSQNHLLLLLTRRLKMPSFHLGEMGEDDKFREAMEIDISDEQVSELKIGQKSVQPDPLEHSVSAKRRAV